MGLGFAQIFNILSNIGISAGSFLCEANNIVNGSDVASSFWEIAVNGFLTIVGNVLYTIAKFALSLIDVIQFIIYKFLGITKDVENFTPYDKNNPLIKFLTNSKIVEILKTTMIVAVVLVIVFSIFSIIKGEWDRASKDQDFNVKRVWGRAFKSMFGMVAFPAIFMVVIILINALLASFSAVLSGNSNTTLGGQVFALCAYDANTYRNYANNNQRIPIYIDFQDPYSDGSYTRYTTEELVSVYDAFASDGKELYNLFASDDFSSFSDTLMYNSSNNSLRNNKSYNGYEKFICTAEQYQVMADFIDYAVAHNIEFYYKPVSDEDIEWKYVNSSIFNTETHALTITYSNASNIGDGNTYTVTYQPADYDLGSPIQNALGTLSTLLSLDGTYYPTLEKLDGTINRVAWATDKVHIKLSENYKDATSDGIPQWTLMDQVILYEYYRYEYNNTFEDYTIRDLEEGIYLDAYTIECQYFRNYTDSYETLKTYDVVIINGTYYLIEQEVIGEKKQYDTYGDPIYTLKNGGEYGTFLNNFSIYNSTNDGQIGVHIEILDNTSHAKIETNTKTPGGKCGCSDASTTACSKYCSNNAGACGCVSVGDSTATEVWYSAVYNMQYGEGEISAKPTKCDNVLTNVCVADTEGRYVEDGVKIIKVESVTDVDNNISEVEHESYGFLNANGFAHEVDRVKATKQVKQVDWAHKLMSDVQNIYRDLNLQQLILTGEWLEVFNSKIEQIGGEYVASFDTSLISPQGLIFSEILLGIVQESDGSTLSEYMFASKYSEQDKKELVLALCGAEDYATVNTTINYFVDLFNQLFTPLLEKIMKNEGQPIIEGEVANVQLYTYKAYLCSLMLSSDSAGFFTDIANHLILMYEFPYDIKVSQPGDYTYAVDLIKEYIFSSYVADSYYDSESSITYTKNTETKYGTSSLPFSFDMTLIEDDIIEYLGDKDGKVTLASLSEHYDFGDDKKLDIGEIIEKKTPKKLLEAINDKLSNTYISLADLVIKENLECEINYGFELAIKDEDNKLTDWGKFLNDNYNEVKNTNNQVVGYKFKNDKVHNFNQLGGYDKLCEDIYAQMGKELNNSSSTSALVQVYQSIVSDLKSQKITEGSKYWPEYLTIFKKYLNGELAKQSDYQIIMSFLADSTNVDGKQSEYASYIKKLSKAQTKLQYVSLMETYMSAFNASDAIKALLKDLGLTSVPDDVVDTILKFTIYDEIVDIIYDLLGGTASGINNENILNTVYTKTGLATIVDRYYSDENNKQYLTQDELINLSGIKDQGANRIIDNSISGFYKQKLIAQQLNAIIDYAYNCPVYETTDAGQVVSEYKNLVADSVVMSASDIEFRNKDGSKNSNAVTCEDYMSYLKDLASKWSEAVTAKQTVAEYQKYFITYTVKMGSTEDVSKTFRINVNNHNYTLSITMPTAKLTEYLLGGKYLEYLGFETIYVESYYTGFLDIKPDASGAFQKPKRGAEGFASINNFLSQLADITMKSEYLTNLQKITKTNTNNQKINENVKLMKAILINILNNDYLSDAVLNNVMGDNHTETFIRELKDNQIIESKFNSVFTYLTGNSKEYSTMTMKQLRLDLMDAIVNYQEDPSSTTKENKDRYLTLFYMFCSDFVENSTTTLSNDTTSTASDDEDLPTFKLDESTKALILKLAGIENMPDEMLVGLEYEDIYSAYNGYDEQNGDVFIICTYDEQKGYYIPFLMSSDGKEEGYNVNGVDWLDYGYGIAKTTYYSSSGAVTVYPVVAKGIITEDGYPTAIRQVDGITEFYRDNIVIRNNSELNLNAYYMSTESISVDYNLFSLLTNSISKLVTGKTLVEHAYSGIPKFSIDSNIRLPFGVDEYSIAMTSDSLCVDYGFTDLSGLSSQNFYKTIDIDFLILFIAILALFPMLIKATYGVFGRVVDITLYYSMSPIMMSTITLGRDTKDGEDTPQFTAWYSKLKDKTISVFGYVIGFHIFFIIVDFFSSVEFITADAFENMKQLANFMPFIQNVGVVVINRLVNLVLIICSAYLINEAPQLFADVMGQSNGFKEGEALKGNIEATVSEVKDVVNGTQAKNAFNFAKESLKDAFGVNAVKDNIGEIKKTGAKVAAKGAEVYMRAHGVPKKVAKDLSKQMRDTVTQDVNNKKNLREERRLQAYDAYYQQLGDKSDKGVQGALQDIDNALYKAGLRNRTEKEHEKIQKAYSKLSGKKPKEDDDKDKGKNKGKSKPKPNKTKKK